MWSHQNLLGVGQNTNEVRVETTRYFQGESKIVLFLNVTNQYILSEHDNITKHTH
jgi:hypothetical protein